MRKVLLLSIFISTFSALVCSDFYFPTWRDISLSTWKQSCTMANRANAGLNILKKGYNLLKKGYNLLMRKKVAVVSAAIITALKKANQNSNDFAFYHCSNNTLVKSSPGSKTLHLHTDALSQLLESEQTAVGTVAALYYAYVPFPCIKIPKLGGIALSSIANGIYAGGQLASTEVAKLLETQKQNKIKILARILLTNEWFHLIAGTGLELGFLHYMDCSPEIKKHAMLSRLAKRGIPLACKTVASNLQKWQAPNCLETPKTITASVLNNDLLHWSLTQAAQYKVDEQLTYDMDQYAFQNLGKKTALIAFRAMQNQHESYKPKGFFDSLSCRLETVQSYIKWNPSTAFGKRIDLIKQF